MLLGQLIAVEEVLHTQLQFYLQPLGSKKLNEESKLSIQLSVELEPFEATTETESFVKPRTGTNDFYCRRSVKRIIALGLERTLKILVQTPAQSKTKLQCYV